MADGGDPCSTADGNCLLADAGPPDAGPPDAGPPAVITVITGDGSRFRVDAGLLARGSGYFRALWRSGMRDSRQEVVCLGCVPPGGFLATLAVLQGGRPLLDADGIMEAVECAAYLQVAALPRHVAALVDADSCLPACRAAAAFGPAELWHAAALCARDAHRGPQGAAELARALPPEQAARVASLPPSVLVAVGAHPALDEDDATAHPAPRTLCYLDEDANAWRELPELPAAASTALGGVAVLDDTLYVVGGVRGAAGARRQASALSFRYIAAVGTWSAMPGPETPRCRFALQPAAGQLYAVGGERAGEGVATASVEAYDPRRDAWSPVAPLSRPVVGVACATAVGRLFACLWAAEGTTEVYEFRQGGGDGGMGTWELLTTLVRRRSYVHRAVGHRANLYVVRNGPGDDFLRCAMDRYSLMTGQWSALPGHFVNSQGALFAAAVRCDAVFAVNRSETQEYAVEGGHWKPRRRWKGFPRSGSLCTFLLRLPDGVKHT